MKHLQQKIPGYNTTSYELNMDYNRLNDYLFNPYARSYLLNSTGNTIEDEAQNNEFWNKISEFLITCSYKQQKNVKVSTENELKVFSLNVQSLLNKIEHFREEIANYEKYDVLCFCETNFIFEKLPNKDNDLLLDGFHAPIHKNPLRTSGKGGGLVTYINKRVCNSENIEEFEPQLDTENCNGEFQLIKLHNCKGFNSTKVVGNIYRSPSGSTDKFVNLFDSVCRSLNRHSRKHIILVGDLNIDLLKHENFQAAQNLIDTLSKYGFVQLVSRPTRITENSCTLIDHVYTNDIENTISCNILTTDISDHLATLTTINLGDHKHMKSKKLSKMDEPSKNKDFRVYNEANNQKFQDLIQGETWEKVFESNDATMQYNKFNEIYTYHYNNAYPLQKNRARRKNERKNPKPWILPWLEDACARKQDLYHLSVTEPTAENKAAYKKMNKFCEKHKKIAQKKYYKKHFENYKDCSKKQWNMINGLLNKNSKKSNPIKLKDSKGTLINSNQDAAEEFNKYFAGIAATIKTEIAARMTFDPGGFQNFLSNPCQNSIFLRPVESSEVHDVIRNFKNKSTLDTKIEPLKLANKNFFFTETIAKMISSSFEQGIFPQALKLARVVPIHKEGSRTDVTNYRPISLLSTLSKVYEKLMHNRVYEFLEKNGTLFESQYGFRPGRSCEHALLEANNHLLETLSKKQIALLLLIDFSKAFDIVEHSILLHKLNHYGIRGMAYEWFKSYLSNREQFVAVNDAQSSTKVMNYGVPQGSILGPLLFIIYINDLPNISKIARFILYADDANIIVTGNSIHEVMQNVNTLSNDLVKWVGYNGLALNLKKTKFMIFARQRIDLSGIELKIRNTYIERKSECRFLGVIMDEKLNWTHHIAAINLKMSRYLGIMFRIKHRLPIKVRIQIFHCFVQAHLNYCPLLWGFSAKSHIQSLFTKQKRGMRAVMPGFVKYFYEDGDTPTHTKNYFKDYEILTVHGVIVMNALLFMHKIMYFSKLLPSSIVNTLPENIPKIGQTHHDCLDWLSICNNIPYQASLYQASLFNKG